MQHSWQVPVADAGQRLDVWIESRLPGVSRNLVQKLLREGRCQVQPGLARPGRFLTGGETIAIEVPAVETPTLVGEDIALNVLHEDDQLVAIDKPPGLVVHPAPGHPRGTLMNAVMHRWGPISGLTETTGPVDTTEATGSEADAETDEDATDLQRLGLVHRLDAETSGIILVARTARALAHLQESFHERRVKKRYLALVAGQPRADYLTCDGAIARHPKDFRKRIAIPVGKPGGKEARTTAVVHWRGDGYSAVEARPRTGRTHQIRVHLAALGHPVLADVVYGRSRTWPLNAGPEDRTALRRQALHAWTLDLPHPDGGELTLRAPIPADIAAWLPGPIEPKPW